MSYRSITVNDKRYEYVVGRTHTKIKRVGIFKNSDIGTPMDIGSGNTKTPNYVVTPSIVADIISGKMDTPTYKCQGDDETRSNTIVKEESLTDLGTVVCDICNKVLR